MIPSPRDPMFGPPPLPARFKEFRKNQWQGIEEIKDCFDSGSNVVFLEAPTGSGKSFVGEATRRLLQTNGLYCCTTKALQDQFAESFEYGKVIKGKSNYLTELGNVNEFGNPHSRDWSAITCADCTYSMETKECKWCNYFAFCPFQVAKQQARQAQLAVLNTSLLLTDARFGGQFSNRGLVVMDEADMIEDNLLNMVEFVISDARLDRIGISTKPRYVTKPESWLTWINHIALPQIEFYLKTMVKPWDPGTNAKQIKEYNSTLEMSEKLAYVGTQINKGLWVYDGYDSPSNSSVIFRPVRVENYGKNWLWPYGEKFLLMSATILSADLMADELGLDRPYSMVTVESSFSPLKRPIYAVPIADMSFKNKQRGWADMVVGVQAVLDRHPDERILVHTVSYELAEYLRARLTDNRPIVTYTSSDRKVAALNEYKRRSNSVLLAASMDRGIDLPDDLCRIQIVAKIPFPNVKDKRIKARLYTGGGSHWYRMNTIRTLIQMCGRAMRHEDDWCKTYILDAQFTENLWKADFLFPEWFKEAMVWSLTSRHLLSKKERK